MLIRSWVSSTKMSPGTRDEKFLHRGSVERVLHRRSMDDCANLLLGIEHHNDSYAVKAWRSSYTAEVRMSPYYGCIEDCTDPLLGIEHHNDSYTVEACRSSYNTKVRKGSYTVEA